MILLKKDHRDPLTGDPIGRSERLSLFAQWVMRRWSFVLIYTGVTIVWWLKPIWFGDTSSYTHWQLAASYGALVIESLVGIGMFGWARRDSIYIRKIHALETAAQQRAQAEADLLYTISQHTASAMQADASIQAALARIEAHDDNPSGAGVGGVLPQHGPGGPGDQAG